MQAVLYLRFLRRFQELAEKEGFSFEEFTRKAKLGELALELWEDAGKVQRPKKVLRADIAKLV